MYAIATKIEIEITDPDNGYKKQKLLIKSEEDWVVGVYVQINGLMENWGSVMPDRMKVSDFTSREFWLEAKYDTWVVNILKNLVESRILDWPDGYEHVFDKYSFFNGRKIDHQCPYGTLPYQIRKVLKAIG